MPPTSSSRSHPRFNGRRVRISDLLDSGLLQAGQALVYQQRLGDPPHRSVVTERGRLRLIDGREFDTPSAAGAAASKLTAVPGWSAWRVGTTGPTLHELRRQLLQTAVTEDADTGDTKAAEKWGRVAAFLAEAQKQAEMNDPKALTVRELLQVWDFEDRDRDAIRQIGADLDNQGLTSEPDFRAVSLDRTIRLITPPEDDPTSSATPSFELSEARPTDMESEDNDDIGLTLGYLIGKKNDLVWIPPSATLETAVTKMEIDEYSQLPVLADPYTLYGVVTWESIARWRQRNKTSEPVLSDVIYTRARSFDYDVRLLDVLETLRTEGYVLVRDFNKEIVGIFTTADLVKTYDETATPFFLIGEVDQELRQLIRNAFDLETVRRVCKAPGNTIRSLDNLTMYHYQTVLNDLKCWNQLTLGLDREVVVSRLDEIRHVRNKVMHFNADLVDLADVDKLRNFLALIRRYTR